jgi:hypothetical protein
LPLRHFWRSKDLSRAECNRPTVLSDLYLRGQTVLPTVKANVRYKVFVKVRGFIFFSNFISEGSQNNLGASSQEEWLEKETQTAVKDKK